MYTKCYIPNFMKTLLLNCVACKFKVYHKQYSNFFKKILHFNQSYPSWTPLLFSTFTKRFFLYFAGISLRYNVKSVFRYFTKFNVRQIGSSQNSMSQKRILQKVQYQKNGLFTKFNTLKNWFVDRMYRCRRMIDLIDCLWKSFSSFSYWYY